jgi:hypothetical protein
MRPDELERRLRERLDALGPAPRAELLHVLMLPDFERADRIGEFWGYPESRTSLMLNSLGARPKSKEQLGDAIGFRLVRCIQVVEAFKALRGEVREVPSQSFPDHLPTRMGQASPRVEHGRWKQRVSILETLVALQCSQECVDARRTRCHPGGGRPLPRRGYLHRR